MARTLVPGSGMIPFWMLWPTAAIPAANTSGHAARTHRRRCEQKRATVASMIGSPWCDGRVGLSVYRGSLSRGVQASGQIANV
jgi:hypothetical protein